MKEPPASKTKKLVCTMNFVKRVAPVSQIRSILGISAISSHRRQIRFYLFVIWWVCHIFYGSAHTCSHTRMPPTVYNVCTTSLFYSSPSSPLSSSASIRNIDDMKSAPLPTASLLVRREIKRLTLKTAFQVTQHMPIYASTTNRKSII